MPLPLSSYSLLACFAQRTRIPTSSRSIGFCVIWVYFFIRVRVRVGAWVRISNRNIFQMYIRKEYFFDQPPLLKFTNCARCGASCGLHVCVCASNYHRMRARSWSVSLFPTIQLVGVGLLEELHDGGVTVVRGIAESRLAILNAQRERRWPWMRSTEQNSGTQ